MTSNTRILPALDTGETYTDPDFLIVQTSTDCTGESRTVIDRMFSAKREGDFAGWICKTITLRNKMTHEAAVDIARAYAEENHVPVVYQQHDDLRLTEECEWQEGAEACVG
jgi:hypothetical protein